VAVQPIAAPVTPADAPPVVLASTASSDARDAASNTLIDRAIGSTKLVSAALSGNAAAAFEVGARYAAGDRIPRNMAKAVEWYRRAAEGGVAVAEFRLASLYERGDGVAQDLDQAMRWYQRAADQGNVNAMHNLAVLLSQGSNAAGPSKVALKWFIAAANYGLRDSQYNLGVIYARGMGTVANFPEAYKWFAIAAAGGDADAGARRDEIGQSMSASEIAQANQTVSSWRSKTPNADANSVAPPAGGWDSDLVAAADQQALVKTIQALLTDQGYDPGPADGRMGPKTRQAVKDYQRKVGAPQTGTPDTALLASLSTASR
jgi:localization factor PodJL